MNFTISTDEDYFVDKVFIGKEEPLTGACLFGTEFHICRCCDGCISGYKSHKDFNSFCDGPVEICWHCDRCGCCNWVDHFETFAPHQECIHCGDVELLILPTGIFSTGIFF